MYPRRRIRVPVRVPFNLNKGLREMNDQRDRFMNDQSSVLLTRKKTSEKG